MQEICKMNQKKDTAMEKIKEERNRKKERHEKKCLDTYFTPKAKATLLRRSLFLYLSKVDNKCTCYRNGNDKQITYPPPIIIRFANSTLECECSHTKWALIHSFEEDKHWHQKRKKNGRSRHLLYFPSMMRP